MHLTRVSIRRAYTHMCVPVDASFMWGEGRARAPPEIYIYTQIG